MKLLFLDHDGVICLSSEWGGRFKNGEGLDSAFDRFNSKAIKILNEIIEETDCEIVVSSDWKYHCTLEQMQELYRIRGIKKSPIGFTTKCLPGDTKFFNSNDDLEESRSHEIKEWLSTYDNITHWVAVDDMDLSVRTGPISGYLWGLTNFVHTPKSNEGIKQSGIKENILKFLK